MFSILPVADGTVDNSFPVSLRLLDQFANLASSTDVQVTLTSTLGGMQQVHVVSIVGSVGADSFSFQGIGSVTLHLTDTFSTGLVATSSVSFNVAPGLLDLQGFFSIVG